MIVKFSNVSAVHVATLLNWIEAFQNGPSQTQAEPPAKPGFRVVRLREAKIIPGSFSEEHPRPASYDITLDVEEEYWPINSDRRVKINAGRHLQAVYSIVTSEN